VRRLHAVNMVGIAKKQPRPIAGDVFLVNMAGRYWVLGRVIRVDAMYPGGWHLVYFYKPPLEDPAKLELPHRPTLLIPYHVVSRSGWELGYFKTIMNRPLESKELLARHIFRVRPDDDPSGWYVDEFDEKVDPPTSNDLSTPYRGVTTYRSVDRELSRALGLKPAEQEPDRTPDGPGRLPVDSVFKGECGVLVYIPDSEDLKPDKIEKQLEKAVKRARAGKWEGHGFDMQRNLLDIRFEGPSGTKLIQAIQEALTPLAPTLPNGWYVCAQPTNEDEQRVVLSLPGERPTNGG